VKILNDGFEYAGARYRSLSAIAQAITGTKWNGYLFFGLGKEHELGDKQKTGASRHYHRSALAPALPFSSLETESISGPSCVGQFW
jgi:hypothetical protein